MLIKEMGDRIISEDEEEEAEEEAFNSIDKRKTISVDTDPSQEMMIRTNDPGELSMDVVSMILALAPAWKNSNFYGIREPEKAVVLMAKAYELGFKITTAFDFFDVIPTSQGVRITLKPKGALALIYRSGLTKPPGQLIIEDRKDACYVYMKRRDNDYGYGFEFTLDMAKRAGIYRVGKNGPSAWEAYPEIMLHWRAIGIVSDIVFPDLKGGLLSSDSYIEINPED